MSIEKLKSQILSNSEEILIEAKSVGSAALPMLKELLEHSDAEVRSSALGCISMIEDKSVPLIVIKALQDPGERVRIQAMQILQTRNLDQSLIFPLVEYVNHSDPQIREGVALLLGKFDNQEVVDSLTRQLDDETDIDVSNNFKLALARLGNKNYKNKIIELLEANESEKRLQALEYLEYINDKTLARWFLPLLSDTALGYEIGDPEKPEYARVCDAVVNLIAKWYKNQFSFEIDELKIYSDEEIEKAKELVKSIGE